MIVTVLRNRGSRSARTLYERLGAVLAPMRVGMAETGSVRRTRGPRYVLNWGVRETPAHFRQSRLIMSNTAEAVGNCSDKIKTLRALLAAEVPCIQFDELIQEQIRQWLEQDGKIVVRHTVTGHSGNGIAIVRRGEEIPAAPLYTRYFRKDAEYRVHVAFGQAISIQQKRKRNGFDENNALAPLVRTLRNGWVFTVNDLSCDELGYRDALHALGVNAAAAVGANHCAVDILVRHASARRALNMVVCEINSAPGIEAESTATAYVNAFVNNIRGLQ